MNLEAPSFLTRLLRRVIPPLDSDRSAERKARNVIALCHALLSARGEVSGAMLARETLSAYEALPDNGLQPFCDMLAEEFSPDPAQIERAATDYQRYPDPPNLLALQRAVEAPRQELFRRLNMAAGGTAVLVRFRSRMLRDLKSNPRWLSIDADLAHLLASWFNRGFLRLDRIDWHTPAIILEKLIEYEAVHEITGWKDLQRRLAADRRCFAFFHPALPDEPLIFIEAALTDRISESVHPLLDPDTAESDPARADCAIFYSITNCQEGLRGISFGNLLIKQVVHELSLEFPRLQNFATLSPIPDFRTWLTDVEPEIAAAAGGSETLAMLKQLQDPAWSTDPKLAARLQPLLMSLCAYYLTEVKKDGDPLDPVARFHLGNGARIAQLNYLADTSQNGIERSAGLMVNYLYRLDDVESNHQAYAIEHRVVASHTVKRLARECIFSRAANNG